MSIFRAPTSAKSLYLFSISDIDQRSADNTFSVLVITSVRRWGIPFQLESSTIFGSIKINFTSLGVARNKIVEIKAFIATLLPEPVLPAINKCGIFPKSSTTGRPETSNPKANPNFDFVFCILAEAKTDFSGTISGVIFGTSIPTKDLPGIGASIRTVPVGVASANAISFASDVILVSFVPKAISNAY